MSVWAKVDGKKICAYKINDVYGYVRTLLHSYTFNEKFLYHFGNAKLYSLPKDTTGFWVLIDRKLENLLVVVAEEFRGNILFTQKMFCNYNEKDVDWRDGTFVEEKRFYCILDVDSHVRNELVFVERHDDYMMVRDKRMWRLQVRLDEELSCNRSILTSYSAISYAKRILKRRRALKNGDVVVGVLHLTNTENNCFVAKILNHGVIVNVFLAGNPLV